MISDFIFDGAEDSSLYAPHAGIYKCQLHLFRIYCRSNAWLTLNNICPQSPFVIFKIGGKFFLLDIVKRLDQLDQNDHTKQKRRYS